MGIVYEVDGIELTNLEDQIHLLREALINTAAWLDVGTVAHEIKVNLGEAADYEKTMRLARQAIRETGEGRK